MAIPHRGWTSDSTYFITASAFGKKCLLQSDRMARLLIEVLYHYREQKKYQLHEFVIMPNHFHLLISPNETLERSMQLIKGGFSFRANRELGIRDKIWETSFYDHRVRDDVEYERMKQYIRENPVKAGLAQQADRYPFSSADLRWGLDDVPQRLKPHAFAEP